MDWRSNADGNLRLVKGWDKMNLAEYLSLDEETKQRYDFSAENATKKYQDATSIEKYIIYKTYYSDPSKWGDEFEQGKKFREKIRKSKDYAGFRDPDDFKSNPNSLLEQIYKKLWPELELCSDTMTSVQYIMSRYFEKETKDDRLKISNRQRCSMGYMINLWAAKEGEEFEKKFKKVAESMNEKEEGLDIFLSAWHTLGNYCPVPSGFNSARSNYGKHDFWDLTMMMIRKWYRTDDEVLKECILREDLFHNRSKGNAIKACVKWLNLCGGEEGAGEVRWERFVQTLCLEDWVNCDKDSSNYEYYEVIPLWEGHGWDNALLPVNNWKGFFMEYNRRILERTKKLIKRLSMTAEYE